MGKSSDDWGLDEGFEGMIEEDIFGDSSKCKKLSAGRVLCSVFIVVIVSFVLYGTINILYTNHIRYPKQEEIVEEQTGMYCLNQWKEQICKLLSTGEDSYIYKEEIYANGNEAKIEFYKKILGTVGYSPDTVNAKNIYGNLMIDKDTDEVVTMKSTIDEGEEVDFSYIDYSAIDYSTDSSKLKIKSLMDEFKLSFGDVDYENKLIDVYLAFMNSISKDDIPLKTIRRVPNLKRNQDGTYSVTEEEDVYLDTLLFSSNEFYDSLDRFSLEAAYQSGRKKPLKETKEFKAWNELSEEEKSNSVRPSQYKYKACCTKMWCGVYYLTEEYTVVASDGTLRHIQINPEVGDGTLNNPAGFNTDMVTSMFKSKYDALGNIVSYKEFPIRVTLKEYGVSKDAIDWFENKDDRNRGISLESDVQYCYMVFEVTNLSKKKLTIKENMGLCDINGNIQARTGIIYGLQQSVTLEPDETGIIETWQSSTELNKKYVVWGADFNRRVEPVWFRLLAGDIDSTDPDRGVTINKSRKDFSNPNGVEESEEVMNTENTEYTN